MMFIQTFSHFSHLILYYVRTSVGLTSCIYIVFSVSNNLTHLTIMLHRDETSFKFSKKKKKIACVKRNQYLCVSFDMCKGWQAKIAD